MPTQTFVIAASAAKTWWLYLLMGSAVAVMLALFVFVHYLARSSLEATFETGNGVLAIHGGFYGRKVPLADLRLGEAKTKALAPGTGIAVGWKRGGMNMPGLKSGWFTLNTPGGKEKALLFLTDPEKAVYIPTRLGYALLLSPEAPEAFFAALKQGG